MGTVTTYYSLYKPADHENDWGTLVRTTLDTIDTQLKSRADEVVAVVSTANTWSAAQLFTGNLYLDSASAGIQIDHSVGSTSTINIRSKYGTNSKLLMRMMPNGSGESATTGDRSELTWMFDPLSATDTGWVDMKTRHRIADDVRFFHILTDRTNSGKQADRLVIEFDPNNIVSANEFSITKNAWYDVVEASGGGSWMFRIQEGLGITHIEPGAGSPGGTIQLATGNLVLGTDNGDVVLHSTGTLRPWGDGSDDLGADGFRWGELYMDTFADFQETGDPTAPGTDEARLYARDNGGGKTQLVVRFATGAVQVLATEP